MRKIVRINNKDNGVYLEVRVYRNNADRMRAFKQIPGYKVWFRDVQGPAIQIVREGQG